MRIALVLTRPFSPPEYRASPAPACRSQSGDFRLIVCRSHFHYVIPTMLRSFRPRTSLMARSEVGRQSLAYRFPARKQDPGSRFKGQVNRHITHNLFHLGDNVSTLRSFTWQASSTVKPLSLSTRYEYQSARNDSGRSDLLSGGIEHGAVVKFTTVRVGIGVASKCTSAILPKCFA